ncbi:hypothetical protein [Ruficoccus sp. ZRK36]|uniref:hypothetical protein n=1 Tax=Ruficoccus sp. ZRK36 TaxID=2866311 RepID=UPI001C73721F|nr:hypothetical protein [Ruficoccus sp. ZRK36]QYY36448.1 hypothetical protein K0V07_03010 [Ruficoccus sp. ZRK36]
MANYTPPPVVNPEARPTTAPYLSADDFAREIQSRQSLSLGIVAGLVASVVAAGVWAWITVLTHFQIGYFAVAVGFFVGLAVRIAGRGMTPPFGVAGACFALLGCVLGNFLSQLGFVSIEYEVSIWQVLVLFDYSYLPEVMIESFQPIDVLFYGIAVAGGYRASFRRISEDELLRLRA